ncbi:fucolectin-like [Engraulis encrasicolus]|uniref:fucolectin-like n=1 Tax=Engraulis encrasicolus TaxID=184585 RepID=UPI002FD6F2E6
MKIVCLLIAFLTSALFTGVQAAENLALYGKATQSTIVRSPWTAEGSPRNAIDGNSDGNFHHGSCSHTDRQLKPWWRVDLLKRYKITSVVITNRDGYAERLNGAEIRIGNNLVDNGTRNPLCAVISSIPAGDLETFQCKNGMEGRYVTVVIPGRAEYLTLCEVEVYGYGQ